MFSQLFKLEHRQTFNNNAIVQQGQPAANTGLLFWFFWALLFVLYYPAAKAGFVTDFTGWLDQVKNHGFWEYINRTNFHAKSLYQFTQFNTYVFYKLFGINAWLWHLLFITLHAINTYLLFKLIATLLEDAGAANGRAISFSGALLFCISPYMSEVIVWEPSFHFLQGLLMILLVLMNVQRFVHSGDRKYVTWSLIIYFLSTFTLEIFYITPWLVLTLGLLYGANPTVDKKVFKKILLYFFAPMMLLFVLRLVVYRVAYGEWVSRIGTAAVTGIQPENFGKPAKYMFHLLLLGRFFPQDIKEAVYAFCDSGKGLWVFYSIVFVICICIIARFPRMGGKGRVASLLFTWTLISLALLIPLWFPNMLLVLFDRYTYFAAAFLYMLVSVLVSFITIQYVRLALIGIYTLINLRYAIQVSSFWGKSYRVDYGLLNNFPDAGNKTVLLLNLPESMKGVPMIGSDVESEYKFMHNLLLPGKKINNVVYDVLSYNMTTPEDGAHAMVLNDSTVRVTLNQWATWWWCAGKGGFSYENNDYKLNLADPGHFYELTLKKPAQQYLLLYSVGSHWKVVDWNKKNEDQD